MINRRDLLVSAAAASAILPASGLPAAAQGLAKTSFGPTTVDISTGHAGHSSLPTALGYWKDEGLDVNVFGVAGETAGVQLLSGSKIDFISLVGTGLLAARAKGIPLKAVYMHARMPIGRFVVPKSAGITKVADLKGKTIGTPVIHPDPYLEGIYKEAGLDPKDIKIGGDRHRRARPAGAASAATSRPGCRGTPRWPSSRTAAWSSSSSGRATSTRCSATPS